MANIPSLDLIQFLVAQGVGVFGGGTDWSLHDGGLPATPLKAIGVVTSGGLGPDTDQLDIQQPTIQVLVCSDVKQEGYDRQEQIRNLFLGGVYIQTPTSIFTQIDMVSDILDIGKDDHQRYVWSANYRARRVLST